MIASLPMYWRPENAAAWQRLWQAVRDELPGLPDLTPPEALPEPWTKHWLDPDLAVSMTCGLPLRTALRNKVTYVATLDFGLDAPAGHYLSYLVARPGASLGDPLRLAYNSGDSQSGWAALHDLEQGTPAFDISQWIETGGHAASLAAVADGRADIAAIDAVSLRLLERFEPAAGQVSIVGRSNASPALPLITALGTDPRPLAEAFRAAVDTLNDVDRADMGGLRGLVTLTDEHYYSVPVPPAVPRAKP